MEEPAPKKTRVEEGGTAPAEAEAKPSLSAPSKDKQNGDAEEPIGFVVITNDGSDENIERLITLKNIFGKQASHHGSVSGP